MTVTRLAEKLILLCKNKGLMAATAESCTGGLISAALTDIPGSSQVFDRGFVTYSNDAKSKMLAVPKDLIDAEGAVSAPVAKAMAEGALTQSKAHLAIAVTGIAGPGGGSAEKPVGLVYIAVTREGTETIIEKCRFLDEDPNADRSKIRQLTVERALEMALDLAQAPAGTSVP